MIDLYTRCIELSKDILSSAGYEIQINSDADFLPYVKIRKRIVSFSPKMESLLLLDAIDAEEEFLNLYLSIKLNENDDYALSNELLDKLEQSNNFHVQDASSLNNDVLIKLLFSLFHEVGHIICDNGKCEKNKGIEQIRDGLSEMIEYYFKDNKLDKEEITQIWDGINGLGDEYKIQYTNNVLNTDYYQMAIDIFNNSDKEDELLSDISAIFLIEDNFSILNIGDKTPSRFLSYFDAMFLLERFFTLNLILDKGLNPNYWKEYSNSYSSKYLKLNKSFIQRLIVYNLFVRELYYDQNDTELDLSSLVKKHLNKIYHIGSLMENKYNKYLDPLVNGSQYPPNDYEKKRIEQRIMQYTTSIKRLYAHEPIGGLL